MCMPRATECAPYPATRPHRGGSIPGRVACGRFWRLWADLRAGRGQEKARMVRALLMRKSASGLRCVGEPIQGALGQESAAAAVFRVMRDELVDPPDQRGRQGDVDLLGFAKVAGDGVIARAFRELLCVRVALWRERSG